MRYDEPRLVWSSLVCPSRTSEREGEGYGVKGEWREGEERVKEHVRRSVNPSKPRPKPNPPDVAERGVASIGVRSSGNLCVDEEYALSGLVQITG